MPDVAITVGLFLAEAAWLGWELWRIWSWDSSPQMEALHGGNQVPEERPRG